MGRDFQVLFKILGGLKSLNKLFWGKKLSLFTVLYTCQKGQRKPLYISPHLQKRKKNKAFLSGGVEVFQAFYVFSFSSIQQKVERPHFSFFVNHFQETDKWETISDIIKKNIGGLHA